MTGNELIAELDKRIDDIPEFALDVILCLCRQVLREKSRTTTERAVLRDVKEFADEKIAALEKERDELRERISSSVNTLRDADESEMEPDTWAAVRVAIDTLEGKQC